MRYTGTTLLNRTGVFAILVMAGFTMVVAAPAHAGGDRLSVSISLGSRSSGIAIGGCVPVQHRPHVSREFQRGLEAGARDGYDAGFTAGLRGWRFCCDFNSIPCHGSREFRHGYESAYGDAYRRGFERGSCERRERECRERAWHTHHKHKHPWKAGR
jgi:hypothetical protein